MSKKELYDKISEQLLLTKTLTLFYSDDTREIIDLFEADDVFERKDMIKYIILVIDSMIETNLVDQYIKTNIYTFLNYIRTKYPEYCDEINKRIIKLNGVKPISNIDFYKDQYIVRNMGITFLEKRLPSSYWECKIADMCQSIARDYCYLECLFTTESEFREDSLETFMFDYYFLYSTNYFCYISPDIYECSEIYNNTLDVLLHNQGQMNDNIAFGNQKLFTKMNKKCLNNFKKL